MLYEYNLCNLFLLFLYSRHRWNSFMLNAFIYEKKQETFLYGRHADCLTKNVCEVDCHSPNPFSNAYNPCFIYNALPKYFRSSCYMFTSESIRKAKIKRKHVYSRRKSTSHPFRPWAELRRLSVNSRCSANLIYSLSALTENTSPFHRPSTDLRSLT